MRNSIKLTGMDPHRTPPRDDTVIYIRPGMIAAVEDHGGHRAVHLMSGNILWVRESVKQIETLEREVLMFAGMGGVAHG